MAEQTSRLAIIIDSTGAKNNADNLTSSLVKMTQAGETAANSAGKVTKATEDEKNALAKLKAAIDPVGAAIDTVGRRYSELKKFFSVLDFDKKTAYEKILTDNCNGFGISACIFPNQS